jgi:hypothetical protein
MFSMVVRFVSLHLLGRVDYSELICKEKTILGKLRCLISLLLQWLFSLLIRELVPVTFMWGLWAVSFGILVIHNRRVVLLPWTCQWQVEIKWMLQLSEDINRWSIRSSSTRVQEIWCGATCRAWHWSHTYGQHCQGHHQQQET